MTPRNATMPDHPQGWRVVGGAFLVLLGGWSAIYAYAAFAPALARAADVTEPSLYVVYALAGGACFLTGALAGPLADRAGRAARRWPARRRWRRDYCWRRKATAWRRWP